MHLHLADRYRAGTSVIHRLDPRVKILLVLIYILGLTLASVGAWASYLAFFGIVVAAAGLSGLGLTYGLRRSYIALPFILAAAALPFTVPGPTLFTLPLLGWPVSEPGWVRFISIALRTWLAVQAAVLLTATTPFPDLLWALGALKVPPGLVAVVGLMYRYLFLAGDEALRMMRARQARAAVLPGARPPARRWQASVAGKMIGSLFLRALERSERVYGAMLARGYDGTSRSLVHFHMSTRDWTALTAGLLLAAMCVALPGAA
jgi:cobalt/nickel transport system permease protein